MQNPTTIFSPTVFTLPQGSNKPLKIIPSFFLRMTLILYVHEAYNSSNSSADCILSTLLQELIIESLYSKKDKCNKEVFYLFYLQSTGF